MEDVVRQAFTDDMIPLAGEIEARLLELERHAVALDDEWRGLLGALHTAKGNCGMVGLDDAEALAHEMERRARELRGAAPQAQAQAIDELIGAADRLRIAADLPREGADRPVRDERAQITAIDDEAAAEPAGPASISHVRIAAERLDRLLDVAADLVILRMRLLRALPRPARRRGARDRGEAPPWQEPIDELGRRLAELRAQVTELRLVPLSLLLGRFDRLVRDLARTTGKPVALTVAGGELAVDKQVVDCLAEPLLHIVRNAVDHGIEPARARAMAGKPERGAIAIEASAHGGVLTMIVRDDGGGIDRARLIAAAAVRGIDARAWPPDEVLELVFAPELSTAERVTTLSGRGIGLDQARRALERIGGSIQVASERGVGTELRLRVPMVIAVQRSLLVRCGAEVYGIPFTSVIEAFRLTAATAGERLPWRDRDLAITALADEIGLAPAPAGRASTCIVIDDVDAPVGLLVDDVLGHEDLTIRELDPVFGRPRSVTGASLLADGRIVPVLDLHGLGRRARTTGEGAAR